MIREKKMFMRCNKHARKFMQVPYAVRKTTNQIETFNQSDCEILKISTNQIAASQTLSPYYIVDRLDNDNDLTDLSYTCTVFPMAPSPFTCYQPMVTRGSRNLPVGPPWY